MPSLSVVVNFGQKKITTESRWRGEIHRAPIWLQLTDNKPKSHEQQSTINSQSTRSNSCSTCGTDANRMGYYTLDFDLQILVCGDCFWTVADQFEVNFRF